jgi:hypothetical protein
MMDSTINISEKLVRYRFTQHRAVDYDRVEFYLMRYEFEGWFDQRYTRPIRMDILTEDGWKEVQENQQINRANFKIPTISGFDMWNEEKMMERLDQFETHIKQVIKHEQNQS